MKTKGVLDEGGQVVDRHSGVRFTVGDGDVIQGKVVVLVMPVFSAEIRVSILDPANLKHSGREKEKGKKIFINTYMPPS